jgi:ATP-dependent helicase/nuclease subunit B
LDGLTVGVIPPVLDQVLIGAVDRSRNPDLKKVFILGFNEGIFPALPRRHGLLNEHDREGLRDVGVEFCNVPSMQMCEENFYGYIAATRARSELCISWSKSGSDGKALNPSRFIPHLQRIFPNLQTTSWVPPEFLKEVTHLCELGPLLDGELSPEPNQKETLAPTIAARLYGKELEAGVSSMERFAMCPFRFFLEKGLGVEERIQFELDVREQGNFQHEVLSAFHLELKSEGREWRSITAAEASSRSTPVSSPEAERTSEERR